MLWEQSKDPLVNLCNAFRRAVVRELQSRPDAQAQILGAFSPQELAAFDAWSKAAQEKCMALQQTLATQATPDPATLAALDAVVLEMSEKSAAFALRVLGLEKLQSFVPPQDLSAATAERFRQRHYPQLARIFSPQPR